MRVTSMLTGPFVLLAAGLLVLDAPALTRPALAQPTEAPAPAAGGAAAAVGPRAEREPPEFPEFKDVTKGLDKLAGEDGSLWTLYKRDKDARLLAELPREFERQRLFIATTYAGGVPVTGIQMGDYYVYWRRFDKRLALMVVNTETRSTGDAENKKSEERLYTDRVLLDVPIATMGPGGGPVIDATDLLVGKADRFWGGMLTGSNRALVKLAKVKAFPQNLELAFELPARGGQLVTIHYSISLVPPSTGYTPREADARVGYFTTSFRDTSRQDKDTQWVRYINRWQLEKRDSKLEMSPPKRPLVFYIEATVPVQYRRYVREGILEWNRAFERVGIENAIEVYQQDVTTGQHMDKDPEDVRYNFVRWTSGDLGFAIGPSRVHPETGQILDADVVIDDGFLRGWFRQYSQLLPEVAMMGSPSELAQWLDDKPQWDPRVRLAPAAFRDEIVTQRALLRKAAHQAFADQTRQAGDEAGAMPMLTMRSGAPLQFGTVGLDPTGYALPMRQKLSCALMLGRSMDVALLRMNTADLLAIARTASEASESDDPPAAEPKADDEKDAKKEDKKDDAKKDDKKEDKKDGKPTKKKEQLLDGLPARFVGPLLKDLVSHEVGHTLGLRHNFKASTTYTLAEMNSDQVKAKAPIASSVMDYTPLNINFNDGQIQGDYAPIGAGPYDLWAIEYGYTTETDLKPILARASEPALAFGTDEDIGGPDPYIQLFDLGKQPLDYSDSTMRLTQHLRTRIVDRVVKDGEPWARARSAYQLLLGRHLAAVRIASEFLGGASTNKSSKGDPGAAAPVVPVEAAVQRRALKFVLDNTFDEAAFGITRELLSKMTVEKWSDQGGFFSLFQDATYPIHDTVLGVQSSAITMVMNPITLQRVYDNEFRKEPDVDAVTVPEVLDTVVNSAWRELDNLGDGTVRKPSISSFRRNLQRELLARLIDLTLPDTSFTAAYRPIQNLTVLKLRELKGRIDRGLNNGGLDPYTKAHLTECSVRIGKALDAGYIYNLSGN